ncbi:neprilysin-1-like isoform X2 [Scylla paramamosain]|uniref:neprilysin-1-like isoform X2 n=1 Tax=Scylla paramamosain TaxID=85552 RepID=UPI003082A6A0
MHLQEPWRTTCCFPWCQPWVKRLMTSCPTPLHAATGSLGRRSSRIWYDCAKKVRLMIPFGVGALYVRHHLSSITQNLTLQMVEDVSAAFRDMLVEASWIDPATLKEALHKLDEMQHLVAFPPHALIDHLLEEYHQGFTLQIPEVKKNDHFGNMLALTAWQCHKSLLKLTSPESQDSWPRGPLDINAFYSALRNAIVIPQGVLQPPIFIPEKLTALNYGSLGSIIGHETTHGFDSTGRMRDAHGNLNHWWTNTTRQQYINRTQCFVKQYSTYDVAPLLPPHQQLDHELMISGERTLAENIADNGGLRAAWVAYQRRVKKDGRAHTLSLPGLQHFTSDQLFFISFAKVWCNNITPFALQYILKADVHVPGYFRILGVLRNSPAFAEAFKCPIGSPMNPKEKCLLW